MPEQAIKLLLVDDNQDSLMLLSFQLQMAGYTVVVAESGAEALIKAEQERPMLSIIDRMMLNIDGIELCERLRKLEPDMFIIMLTAMGKDEDRIRGLEAGVDDYIVKPVSPKELILRVQAVLRRARNVFTTPNSESNGPKNKLQVPTPPSKTKITGGLATPNVPTTMYKPDLVSGETPNQNKFSQSTSPKLETGNAEPTALFEIDNKNLEAVLEAASRAAQSQDVSRARELYLYALKLEASNESALMWLAWYTTDPYEGCNYLERLVTAHPENSKLRELLTAGRRRCQELDQLILDSNVVNYWNIAEQMHNERIRDGVDRRSLPVLPVGQILLKKGFITQEQLETAVSLHEMVNRLGTPKKLGEVLLEYGYLTKEQLHSVLSEQQTEFYSQFY